MPGPGSVIGWKLDRDDREELLRQLEAELEQLKVADVLVQTVFTLSLIHI